MNCCIGDECRIFKAEGIIELITVKHHGENEIKIKILDRTRKIPTQNNPPKQKNGHM